MSDLSHSQQFSSIGDRLAYVYTMIKDTREALKKYEQQRELLIQLFLSEKGHVIKLDEEWFIHENKLEVWRSNPNDRVYYDLK